MKTYLIADTHLNPLNEDTYCQRPEGYTNLIIRNWKSTVKPEDLIIHLGDVGNGNYENYIPILKFLPGRKVLVRGNHDRKHSNLWWMSHGFDFSCDSMIFRNSWLTHEPSERWPGFCDTNIHGHLHNCWTGFGRFPRHWRSGQRLLALEYTNYRPVDAEKFLSHPDKYKSVPPED